MNCQYCDNQLPSNVTQCPYCGASVQSPQSDAFKSRVVYIVLALTLGWVGIHDFYVGRSRSGEWHLALFIIGLIFCLFGGFVFFAIAYIWALFEAVFVTTDGKGQRLI